MYLGLAKFGLAMFLSYEQQKSQKKYFIHKFSKFYLSFILFTQIQCLFDLVFVCEDTTNKLLLLQCIYQMNYFFILSWMKGTCLSYMLKYLTFYCKEDSSAPINRNSVVLSQIRCLSSILAKVSFRYVHRGTSNKLIGFLGTKLFLSLTCIERNCYKQESVRSTGRSFSNKENFFKEIQLNSNFEI